MCQLKSLTERDEGTATVSQHLWSNLLLQFNFLTFSKIEENLEFYGHKLSDHFTQNFEYY